MASLMVRLELGQSNAEVLKITGALAGQLDANVIGVAACQPIKVAYGDAYLAGEVIQQDRDEIDKEIAAAEAEFRRMLKPFDKAVDFRATVTFDSLSDCLARHARSADLVITGVDRAGSLFDSSRHLAVSDLVMQAGRPVLIVPGDVQPFKLNEVLVGWKETRETRRAVLDAIPLLRRAKHVTIVEIATDEHLDEARIHLGDVMGWLRGHGVEAQALAAPAAGDDATRLGAIAAEHHADLIVAGAYGHNRFREWALGGVTSDLLLRADRCSLLSH